MGGIDGCILLLNVLLSIPILMQSFLISRALKSNHTLQTLNIVRIAEPLSVLFLIHSSLQQH